MLYVIKNNYKGNRGNKLLDQMYPCLKKYHHWNMCGVTDSLGYSVDRNDYIDMRTLDDYINLQKDLNNSDFEPKLFKTLEIDFINHRITILYTERKEDNK